MTAPDGTGRAALARRAVLLLLALLAVQQFAATLVQRSLWIPDEGRYAEIGREMLATGDWVVPRLNGIRYFEKPPLVYWGSALGMALFGTTGAGARMPVVLAGLGLLALTWWLGSLVANRRAAWLAAAMLAASPAWYSLAQFLVLDMPLALCVGAGLTLFYRGWRDATADEPPRLPWKHWCVASAAFFGLGTLAKGPIAVVLGAMVLAPLLFSRPRAILALPWGRMLAVYGLVTVPWFVAIARRHPEFLHFFFVHEHLERYTQPGHARPGAAWYFLPVLIAGFFPWSCLAPAGLKLRPQLARGAGLLLGCWIVVPVAFFSLSSSKLPAYVLPVFPALAVWVAASLEPLTRTRDNVPERSVRRWLAAGAGLVGLVALGVIAKALSLPKTGYADLMAIRGQAMVPLAACALGGLGAAFAFLRGRVGLGLEALAAIALVGLSGAALISDRYQVVKDCHELAGEIRARRAPGEPVLVYGTLESASAVPFYLGEPIQIGGHHFGELSMAHANPEPAEAALFVHAGTAVERMAPDQPRTWFVTGSGVYRDYFCKLPELRPVLVFERGGRVVFTNR